MGYSNVKDGSGKEITIEDIEKLYYFLQGELPKDITMTNRPKLSERKAFKIIWFLQEEMNLLPDKFERCCRCGRIYDSWKEGHHKNGSFYCGGES